MWVTSDDIGLETDACSAIFGEVDVYSQSVLRSPGVGSLSTRGSSEQRASNPSSKQAKKPQ